LVDSRAVTGEVSFSDIAVLYRTDAQSGPVLEALSRAGIPFQKRSHNRLLDRPGVPELARELRLAATPGPAGPGELPERVRRAGQALADRYDAPTLDPAGAVAVHPSDLWSAVELLLPLARRCGDDLPRFLADLVAGTEVDALDPRAEAVTLLTLHAAKGLEFPVVFLVGVEDGKLPHSFGGAPLPEPALAEERRLFFVGLTRAQDRLYLSYTRRPSRFLSVIQTGLFEPLGGTTTPDRTRHQQPRLL
jgi:superfamily I DNA/RNA helicase